MTLKCGLLAGSAALVCGIFLAVAVARSQARPDIFTVMVPVDATAANASAARDEARHEGEAKAYTVLLERLTLARDHARLPPANDTTLTDLILAFEVAHERRSSVRYLADYSFHFRADGIRRLLREAGIPFAETLSKPLVVLAVLEGQGGPRLWEDPNKWRDAWAKTALPQGLVPLIVPLGELEDVAAIDGATADNGDDAHLQAISARYGRADVLVTRAAMKSQGHGVDVTTTRFIPGTPGGEQTWVASYAAAEGENDDAFLARVIAGTIAQVEQAWKQANVIDFSQTGTLTVSVPISDLQSWIALRERLKGMPEIRQSELLSINRQEAQVALHYVGDPAQLRVALTQRDLVLSGDDPNWVLQRHTGAASP